MLLASGADPNLKVLNEEDGAQLRPALAEYLASNVEPSAAIVSLLLRYGARVSIIDDTRCSRRGWIDAARLDAATNNVFLKFLCL